MEWKEVKRGWVYQRKSQLFGLTHSWSPRYLVIYQQPIPSLALYEQRSDAQPPYRPCLHWDLAGLTVGGDGEAAPKQHRSIPSLLVGRLRSLAKGTASALASRRNSVAPASSSTANKQSEDQGRERLDSQGSGRAPPPPSDHGGISDQQQQLIYLSRPALGPDQPAQSLVLACVSQHERQLWLTALQQATPPARSDQPVSSTTTRSRTQSTPRDDALDPMDVVFQVADDCL